jgi:hypothetical protein
VSEKTQAKLVELYLKFLKSIKPTVVKIQKTTIYKKIKVQLSKVSKRNKIIGGVIIAAIVLFFGWNLVFNSPHDTPIVSGQTQTPKLEKGTPSYATVLPQGKSIKSLGGWTKISPPKASPVYTYIDRLENVQINVSEQPLPDSFKSDTAKQLQQLAEDEKATQKITIGSNTIYIGTSSQGPQSIFFIKNNLLILIKSDATISENSWVKYINSLQ